MSTLHIGDPAPAFEALDQHEKTVRLEDFKGKKLILYFYPKDQTPGCTTEACNFRDHYEELLQKGYAVVGVSIDSVASHQKFAAKQLLPFQLLADVDKKLVEDYGVWVEKNLYGKNYMGTARTTFVINEQGRIRQIIRKVDNKNAVQQILALEERNEIL
jgi:peroxiredoxin Q/BCP